MLGSDIHRNVSVDPVCSGAWKYVCQGAAALYPSTLTLLVNGGPLVLSDGARLSLPLPRPTSRPWAGVHPPPAAAGIGCNF